MNKVSGKISHRCRIDIDENVFHDLLHCQLSIRHTPLGAHSQFLQCLEEGPIQRGQRGQHFCSVLPCQEGQDIKTWIAWRSEQLLKKWVLPKGKKTWKWHTWADIQIKTKWVDLALPVDRIPQRSSQNCVKSILMFSMLVQKTCWRGSLHCLCCPHL
jgi:hypothetical protein